MKPCLIFEPSDLKNIKVEDFSLKNNDLSFEEKINLMKETFPQMKKKSFSMYIKIDFISNLFAMKIIHERDFTIIYVHDEKKQVLIGKWYLPAKYKKITTAFAKEIEEFCVLYQMSFIHCHECGKTIKMDNIGAMHKDLCFCKECGKKQI